ncbi:glycoside hydrolase family 32 protein [Gallibacterium salpingitidis]|uniref:glycoside hydrolase family 32 protein n=1 Tax=Gallibacterium salpingitidis TaxID=505341 RepID=UPI00266F7342|nr:glycoside hydrolase family 32 protein [Gallibacterium salpingitidis]WKS99720.1 glycoside hydrolase family 32 protein [Gallibacterium salpingitidis]
MIVFNQGKYRSLYTAQPNELATLAAQVASDCHHRPAYHLAPSTGLLNDPNGLIFDGSHYHIFYQWYPFGPLHGMKHWRHYRTQDFCHFEQADALIPDELFESHGCYSGGAINYQDKIVVFYTGNTRRSEDNQRIPFQNIAIFDRDGHLLEKRPLLNQAPNGYTEHCRDPKPFVTADGKIRFVLGAQREDLSGTALLFEMANLQDQPHLLGELTLTPFANQGIFMWECPDLGKLGSKDLFIWSPQGKKQETTQFQNNYHATYAIGQLENLTFHIEQFAELDQGFDFYAPQSFAGLATQESKMLFAWCGLPDLQYPTDRYQWHSMLTLPRKLWLQNNQLYQRPIEQVYQQIENMTEYHVIDQSNIEGLAQSYLHIKINQQPFKMQLFSNELQQHLTLSYQNGCFCLDRSATEQTESMRKFGEQRYCQIDNLQEIELFIDHSIIEIFFNRGEKAMTSRFFIENKQNTIVVEQPITITIGQIQPIQFSKDEL